MHEEQLVIGKTQHLMKYENFVQRGPNGRANLFTNVFGKQSLIFEYLLTGSN